MDNEIREIERVIQLYFDGLYHSDVEKIGQAFHTSCHLYAESEGKVIDLPVPKWLEMLAARPSAASRNLPREDRIVTVDFSGPSTALVKVQCAIPPRFFTDYLTLLKLEEGWRVISKTYRFETR